MKLKSAIPSAMVTAKKAHETRKSLRVLNSKNVRALIIERNDPKITLAMWMTKNSSPPCEFCKRENVMAGIMTIVDMESKMLRLILFVKLGFCKCNINCAAWLIKKLVETPNNNTH